jgi:aspartyl-tRNA(Asn)/glutamyl-tRNA(Gln) amidotransferase subunit A
VGAAPPANLSTNHQQGENAVSTDPRDPAFLAMAELSQAFQSRRLSPVELVERYLERIRAHDEKLHAFVTVYEDDARLAAEAADRAIRSGHAVGPLHGLPVAVKDIVDIEGRVTTGGSQHWASRVSPITATIVRRMVAAGMIVLGKTHTVEFAMGSYGTNTHMGTPWNPWDLAIPRTPGGSSSGSAVAVAAGLAPIAIGTDTGGSVRVPAGWCGLTGLKTTLGRISRHGILPLALSLDTVGPIARTVEDAALLYDVLRGPDPEDDTTRGRPQDDPFAGLRRGVAGLRIARPPATELEGVEAAVLEAWDAGLAMLERLGARIVEVTLPRRLDELGRMVGRIIGAEGYSYVGELVDDPSLPIDDNIRPRIQLGRDIKAHEYQRLLREREELKRDFTAALDEVDALLLPTTRTPAIPLPEVDESGTAAVLTRPVNAMDACALAVPNGFTADGLPLSMQIVCRPFAEAMALRIGHAYQQATEWHLRRPGGL